MTWNDILQTAVSGFALGSTYALVALGFVIVFAATRIMNFSQGAFVLLGAYLTYQFGAVWNLGFFGGLLCSVGVCGLTAILTERFVMRRFAHRPTFSVLMVTIGVLYIFEAIVSSIWGVKSQNLGDPWRLDTITMGGVAISVSDIWTLAISVTLIIACFLFLTYTRGGLSMRASASDKEAAVSIGINPRRVTYGVWFVAGALGAVAGTLLATGSSGVTLGLTSVVFATMPAVVLGGLDSPVGAIVGGFAIGLVQQFTALVQPVLWPDLGSRFATVTPFIVLLLVLLIRPKGLFGTRAVERF
ncbi:branched-chain amino acid ABC transporter permease [Arthrobacter methylotrophus]|uniref:Branched-chain amino acid ABC transporter permease n=1 Tax=Arthrobacter methylotrophus TaxID=121291 RepID=A0ABV5UJL6_9MICC